MISIAATLGAILAALTTLYLSHRHNGTVFRARLAHDARGMKRPRLGEARRQSLVSLREAMSNAWGAMGVVVGKLTQTPESDHQGWWEEFEQANCERTEALDEMTRLRAQISDRALDEAVEAFKRTEATGQDVRLKALGQLTSGADIQASFRRAKPALEAIDADFRSAARAVNRRIDELLAGEPPDEEKPVAA